MTNPAVYSVNRFFSHLVPRQRVLLGVLVFVGLTFVLRSTFYPPASTPLRAASEESGDHEQKAGSAAVDVIVAKREHPKNIESKTKASDEVPQFVPFRQHYKLSEKGHVRMCVIGGNEPAVFSEFTCFLADGENFKKAERSIRAKPYEERLCRDNPQFEQESPLEKKEGDEWIQMAVVRNPMERFIAAFTAQCVLNKQPEDVKQKCGDCGRNSTCFLERLEKKLTDFVADPTVKMTIDEEAFFPQNWNCEFGSKLKNYTLLRMEIEDEGNMKLLNDLYFGLRERDVNNDDLTLMYKTLQEIRPAEGTRDVDESILESELRANPGAMEIFTRIYAADYRLFKFELPTASAVA